MSPAIQTLESFLPAAARGIVSIVGAGGKTSLMFHLARMLSEAGQKVLTTTTTKIYEPTSDQSATVLIGSNPQDILSQAAARPGRPAHLTAAAARMGAEGKLKGFAPDAIDLLAASGMFDWILVEADGAARRPLKAPAEHEPVIPVCSKVVIAVAGLDALGTPLEETGVFRAELAAARMGLPLGESITASALCRLISHPLGSFKDVPETASCVMFLNKADTPARREVAAEIAAELEKQPRPVVDVLLAGEAQEALTIHAAYSFANRT